MNYLGFHVLLEAYECDRAVLNSEEKLKKLMLEAAKKAGATIVGHSFYKFNPHGISGLVIITESHLAIHTWPEFGYAAIDVFTCGKTVDTTLASNEIITGLKAKKVLTKEMRRGKIKKL